MKKNIFMKKAVTCLLIGAMTATIFTGCGNKGNSDTSTTTKEENATKNDATTNSTDNTEQTADSEHPFYVTDTQTELTIHMHYWDYMGFDDSWKVFQKAAEMTNVKLKGTAPAGASNSKEIFNIMMVNNDIPDIVNGMVSDIKKYGEEGAFYPLNDILEECAPDFNRFLNENPDIRKGMTSSDGNIYVIPYIVSDPLGKVWFVRQDWLDKVNMPVPTTADELHDVMKAFVDQDVNGNGLKDESPYFGRDLKAISDLLAVYGIPESFYVKDGKVVSNMYMPELKEALTNVVQWYKEGLIDKEIFTRGGTARDEMFGQNIGGVIHDWFPSTSNYNAIMAEQVEGFKLVSIAPPNAQLGTPVEYSSPARASLQQQGLGISAKTKDPKLVLKYLNFFWTEEGRRLANFGIEGEQYDLVDGQAIYREDFLKSSDKSIKEKLEDVGAQTAFGYEQDYNYTAQTLHEEARRAMDLYGEGGYMVPNFPILAFTAEEQAVYDSNYQAVEAFYYESLQKWILGDKDVESTFDAYMERMKELGIEDIISAHQSAYERFLNN